MQDAIREVGLFQKLLRQGLDKRSGDSIKQIMFAILVWPFLAFPAGERTPTGTPCVQLVFETPGGCCNVISPELAGAPAWRNRCYGAVALWVKGDCGGRLFRANLIKRHEPALGCARILDWPDRPMRMVVQWLHTRYRAKEPRNDLSILKSYVKNHVAGNRFNCWSLMLEATPLLFGLTVAR